MPVPPSACSISTRPASKGRLEYYRDEMRATDVGPLLESSSPRAGGERDGRYVLLGALCFATFLATSNGVSISPFLLDMARDLGTDLAAVGNLVAILSISWGATSVMAGAASDRLGRKPIMLGALLVLVASPVGVALSETYAWVVAWRLVGGIGGGAYMGTVFAAVSDRFPAAERGRALGWIMTGQSLSLVLGVPILTLIGSVAGWRGALTAHGVVTLAAALAVWLVVPRATTRRTEQPMAALAVMKLLQIRVLALLASSATERVCYGGVAVFFPTYLLATYGVSAHELAVGLLLVALGNLVGNIVGGHVTDRLPASQLVFAASLAVTGLLALPVLLWQPGVEVSLGLGFAYTFVNALGRPALLAAVSEVSNEARGAVLGLNITFSSFGWLGATALGGLLITSFGFSGLGILTAAMGLVGAALALFSWLAAGRRARQ